MSRASPSDERPHPCWSRDGNDHTDKESEKADPFNFTALSVTDTDNDAARNERDEQDCCDGIHNDVCHALDFRLYLCLKYVFECA